MVIDWWIWSLVFIKCILNQFDCKQHTYWYLRALPTCFKVKYQSVTWWKMTKKFYLTQQPTFVPKKYFTQWKIHYFSWSFVIIIWVQRWARYAPSANMTTCAHLLLFTESTIGNDISPRKLKRSKIKLFLIWKYVLSKHSHVFNTSKV